MRKKEEVLRSKLREKILEQVGRHHPKLFFLRMYASNNLCWWTKEPGICGPHPGSQEGSHRHLTHALAVAGRTQP